MKHSLGISGITLLAGGILLVSGFILPLYPYNGLILLLGLSLSMVGYVLNFGKSNIVRIMKSMMLIAFILFATKYFYTSISIPKEMKNVIDNVTTPVLLFAICFNIYVRYVSKR